MTFSKDLEQILNRMEKGEQTHKDIEILLQLLIDGDHHLSNQLGKYNVNITEGQNIQIGDRYYNQWNQEAIEALVKAIQNTRSGDVAGKDVNKQNYENCTIINLPSASQEYFDDSFFYNIPIESIQQAYQKALPPDAGVWNLRGNNLQEILKEIQIFRRRFEFIFQLSQDKNITEELRYKLSDIAYDIDPKKYQDEKNKPQTDKLESYLMATIKPCDTHEQFLLNAWLIADDSLPVYDLSRFIPLLDDPNQLQQGVVCKFYDIPQELNKFIKKSLRLLRGKQYQLTIEVFLPRELICTEVDRWKVSDPIEEEITIGIRYPIRLRSLERLDINYLDHYLSDWYKHWYRVKTALHNQPIQELFEHLQEMESCNWNELIIKLQEKIGLKITCALPKAKTKDLFKAILRAATPIAIWTRCDIPNCNQVAAIDEILNFKPLSHLCESVRETRQRAEAQTEEHLGFHLAVLWEDPHRLTPDIMVQLKIPGQ